MEQFDYQKERQAQLIKDLKEKESSLQSLTNEVNSKTKLLNLANQQLPQKEARVQELDKMIKEKEAKLKELESTIEKRMAEQSKDMKALSMQLNDTNVKLRQTEETLKEREEAIDSYKKKIVALEFAQEDYKKREDNFLLRIKEMQEQLRLQQQDMDDNYRKVVEIEYQSTQTDPVSIKTKEDSEDKQQRKLNKEAEKKAKKEEKERQKQELKEKMEDEKRQIELELEEQKAYQQKEKEAYLKQIRELQDHVSKQNIQIEQLQSAASNFNATANMELEVKYQNEQKELQKLKQKLSEIEPKYRELEVKQVQTEMKLNQVTISTNEQKLQNEALQQKCDQQTKRIRELKSQVKQLSQEKEEFDKENQKRREKMKLLQQQVKIHDEEMMARDAEIENKAKVLERMMQANEDMKKENQKLSLKLRQIQTTQIKDLNKKVRDKDSEIEVLKEMLRSSQLQSKSKDNEIQRLQKKINRMTKEGYVEKMQAYVAQRPNNNHIPIHHHVSHAADRTADRTIDIEDIDVRTRDNFEEDNDREEEEDFYDNNDLNTKNQGNDDIRAVRVKLMGKKDLILPDISQKSGSSQVNSMFDNGLVNRRSQKDIHSNMLFDQELDETNVSRNQLMRNKRKAELHENNKVFESQYNRLVDEYQRNASSSRQMKFSSVGVSGAMSNEPSPNINNKRMVKNSANYQSLDNLRGMGQSELSSISGTRQRQRKLINILEEKSDYLVISPPKIGGRY